MASISNDHRGCGLSKTIAEKPWRGSENVEGERNSRRRNIAEKGAGLGGGVAAASDLQWRQLLARRRLMNVGIAAAK